MELMQNNSKLSQWQNFTRLETNVNVSPILHEIEVEEKSWLVDTSRQRKVRCQRHTQNIFLRVAKKPLPAGAKNANDVHESRSTKMSNRFPHTMEFCTDIADNLSGQLGRVLLVTLLPKCRVYPHIDRGEYYRIRDRFHLVLKSSKGSSLTSGKETVIMHEGELWVFDNKKVHSAENLGNEPRIHLIFDILPASDSIYYAHSA